MGYKNLTAEEKASWEARAQEDKLRYVGQMANYTPPPGHNAQGITLLDPNSANNNVKRRAKRKTKDKDPNAPKRACGAYVFFTNEMRPIVMKKIPSWHSNNRHNEINSNRCYLNTNHLIINI